METSLEKLIKRLDSIAKKNGDRFKCSIEIDCGNRIFYTFAAVESADNHVFVGGNGTTIEDAVRKTETNIESSCKSWGYNE